MKYRIDSIIDCINGGNELDEEEARILKIAVKRIQKKRHDHFEATLKRASEIVESWPKWKREGGLARLQPL